MDQYQKQIDELKTQVNGIDEKLDSVLELVQMGKGILWLAKIGAACMGFAATVLEVWRWFFGSKG